MIESLTIHEARVLQVRDRLGWESIEKRVVQGERYDAKTQWVVEFADRCLQSPSDCDLAFGFRPHASQSPASILGIALRVVGIKTKYCRLGIGDRRRVYQIDASAADIEARFGGES